MIDIFCHEDTSLIIAEDGGGLDVFNIHVFRENLHVFAMDLYSASEEDIETEACFLGKSRYR